PITESLARLPASYDDVRTEHPPETARPPSDIPQLTKAGGDPMDQAEQMERARLARMAGQARESQVFFRLQLKAPPQEKARPTEPSSQSRSATSASDNGALTAL